jgi:hypothetical protein
VVAVSTVVLAAHARDHSVTRALLRAVSVMATAAPLGGDDFTESPTMQVFVSALRIVGAVLIAAFTAFATQYLLRTRLAGVRLAVSEALAAPAFLAGLYGDRVECVFIVRERPFVVINLMVEPGGGLEGCEVESVARDLRLLPLGERLRAGDRLLGVIELSDLDEFFRRQARPARPA